MNDSHDKYIWIETGNWSNERKVYEINRSKLSSKTDNLKTVCKSSSQKFDILLFSSNPRNGKANI